MAEFKDKKGVVNRVSAKVFVKGEQDDKYYYGVVVDFRNRKNIKLKVGRFNQRTDAKEGFTHESNIKVDGEVINVLEGVTTSKQRPRVDSSIYRKDPDIWEDSPNFTMRSFTLIYNEYSNSYYIHRFPRFNNFFSLRIKCDSARYESNKGQLTETSLI